MTVDLLPADVLAKLRSAVAITTPSHCMEELVLNSLDAGATCIAVRLNLPYYRIQVVDNGCGIPPEELRLLGTRYATSKCHSLEDLKKLHFYGFRGEALASLKEVCSTVEILSRTKFSDAAYYKVFQHGIDAGVSRSGKGRPSPGTTVTVMNFMYNMPVRKQLISPALDVELCRQGLEGIALIHPEVSFSLRNDINNELCFQARKTASVLLAFGNLFGQVRTNCMKKVHHKHNIFEIFGYISTEGHVNKHLQFVYINKRLILKTRLHKSLNFLLKKHAGLRHKQGVRGAVSPSNSPSKGQEKYGVFVLNVSCALDEYDICLEPRKTLVEFQHWDELLKSLDDMVNSFLKAHNLLSSPHIIATGQEMEIGSEHMYAATISNLSIPEESNFDNSANGTGEMGINKYGKKIHVYDVKNVLVSLKAHRPKSILTAQDFASSTTNNDASIHVTPPMPGCYDTLQNSASATPAVSKLPLFDSETPICFNPDIEDEPSGTLLTKGIASPPSKTSGLLSSSEMTVQSINEEFSTLHTFKELVKSHKCLNKQLSTSISRCDPCMQYGGKDPSNEVLHLAQPSAKHKQPMTSEVKPLCQVSKEKNKADTFLKFKEQFCYPHKLRTTVTFSPKIRVSHCADAQIYNHMSGAGKSSHANYDDSRLNKSKLVQLKNQGVSVPTPFVRLSEDGFPQHFTCVSGDLTANFEPKEKRQRVSDIDLHNIKETEKENLPEWEISSTKPFSVETPFMSPLADPTATEDKSSINETQPFEICFEVSNHLDISLNVTCNKENVDSQLNKCSSGNRAEIVEQLFEGNSAHPGLSTPQQEVTTEPVDDFASIDEAAKLASSNEVMLEKLKMSKLQSCDITKVSTSYAPCARGSHATAEERELDVTLPSDSYILCPETTNSELATKSAEIRNDFSLNFTENQAPIITETEPTCQYLETGVTLDGAVEICDGQPTVMSHHEEAFSLDAYVDLNGTTASDVLNLPSNSTCKLNEQLQPIPEKIKLDNRLSPVVESVLINGSAGQEASIKFNDEELTCGQIATCHSLPGSHDLSLPLSTLELSVNFGSDDTEQHDIYNLTSSSSGNSPCKAELAQLIKESQSQALTNNGFTKLKRNVQNPADICQISQGQGPSISSEFESLPSLPCAQRESSQITQLLPREPPKARVHGVAIMQLSSPGSVNQSSKIIEGSTSDSVLQSTTWNLELSDLPSSKLGDCKNLLDSQSNVKDGTYQKMNHPRELGGHSMNDSPQEVSPCISSTFLGKADSMTSSHFLQNHRTREVKSPNRVLNEDAALKCVSFHPGGNFSNSETKVNISNRLQTSSSIMSVQVQDRWLCWTDETTNQKLYVDQISGNSSYKSPEITHCLVGDSNGSKEPDGDIAPKQAHFFLSHNATPFLPRPKHERTRIAANQEFGISDNWDTSDEIFKLVQGHQIDSDLPSKWKTIPTSAEISSEEKVACTLKSWNNSVLQPVSYHDLGLSTSKHISKSVPMVQSYRLTKATFDYIQVIGQVDNKFIACIVPSRKKLLSADLDLIVLFDQHAAHERIRLEDLTADLYDTSETGDMIMKTSSLHPPLDISMEPHFIRLARAHQSQLLKLGMATTVIDDRMVQVTTLPVCLVEKEAGELKRGRASVALTVVENLLKEQLQMVQETRGASAALPKSLSSILNSQACHGAVKFGDSLKRNDCQKLIAALGKCKLPFQCAHGRPAVAPVLDLSQPSLCQQHRSRPHLWRIRERRQVE